ncbi:hypothetical protein HMPREF9447_02489 [Bacteroides oleiciplenus YIT 12058]|uniref:Uncharacterized protein n=1 Tax=Bacteroides oleiciplenus YIT 12058 TaxID=742727 RepID=K9E5H4_9BACE|nr:hypothetical protein HMPREF9447_02489 [Bacteroides oleiciplenus YIT 12058]
MRRTFVLWWLNYESLRKQSVSQVCHHLFSLQNFFKFTILLNTNPFK